AGCQGNNVAGQGPPSKEETRHSPCTSHGGSADWNALDQSCGLAASAYGGESAEPTDKVGGLWTDKKGKWPTARHRGRLWRTGRFFSAFDALAFGSSVAEERYTTDGIVQNERGLGDGAVVASCLSGDRPWLWAKN